jgi:hypothetical protein
MGIAATLEGQARLATIVGNDKYVFQLLGAARAVRQQFALPIPISEQVDLEAALQPAYLSMNEIEARISIKEGHRANVDDFIRSIQKDPL